MRKLFPDVHLTVHYSRHHNTAKDGKPAAPRFHVFFPLRAAVTNAGDYRYLKELTRAVCPALDANCKDAARFFYGTKDPVVAFYPGNRYLDEFLLAHARHEPVSLSAPALRGGVDLREGERNSGLYRIARQTLDVYGDGPEGRKRFDDAAARCTPPLPAGEVEGIWRSACKGFAEKVAHTTVINPAQLPADVHTLFPPNEQTSLTESQVFLSVYPDVCRYSPQIGWLCWDGTVWKEDPDGLAVKGLLQEFTQMQAAAARKEIAKAYQRYLEAKRTGNLEAANEAKKDQGYWAELLSFACRYQEPGKLNGVLEMLKPSISVDAESLDADPFLLATPTGYVNLHDGTIQPPDPGRLVTKITSCGPSKDNGTMWERFLDDFTDGDKDLRGYLQRICGMCVVGRIFTETLVVCIGPGGNGKSTFWNTVLSAMGDYAGTLPADTLTTSGRGSSMDYYLADLRGKRLALMAELEDGRVLSGAALKKLCSTDRISARQIYCSPFSFMPSHSCILFSNVLPQVTSNDLGTWDRLTVLPLLHRFRGSNNEVKNYAAQLLEHCGSYVLGWIVEGARLFIQDGCTLTPPAVVQQRTAEYRASQDIVAMFLRDRCEIEPDAHVSSSILYNEFMEYARYSGESHISTGAFKERLRGLGIAWKRTKTSRLYVGVRLLDN